MLDKTTHEILLKKILADIYQNKSLQTSIAFKGGTCLYFFYNLDRFSTDLDFNLLDNKNFKPEKMSKILEKYLTIEQEISKRNTWFWIGSFEKGRQKIKIEISKRDFADDYVNKDFYGFTVPTMSPNCMFAHKLCAIKDRSKLQNRDLYDTYFMFQNSFEIEEKIVKLRTGKNLQEYFQELIDFIQKNVNPVHILDGLGEVLDEKQKIWVKKNLIKNLLFELKIRVG